DLTREAVTDQAVRVQSDRDTFSRNRDRLRKSRQRGWLSLKSGGNAAASTISQCPPQRLVPPPGQADSFLTALGLPGLTGFDDFLDGVPIERVRFAIGDPRVGVPRMTVLLDVADKHLCVGESTTEFVGPDTAADDDTVSLKVQQTRRDLLQRPKK